MSNPMYPPPPPSPPPPPYNPPPPMGGPPMGGGPPAAQAVQGPAMGLMITGGIGILFGVLGLVMNVLGLGMSGMQSMGGGATDQYMSYMSGGMGIVSGIISLGISGFILWAAMQMKQLRNWNMSMAASIVAMIPCIGPCCIVGIPVGIWAVMTLLKPEVKSAFVG